jgi:hypothetical protein
MSWADPIIEFFDLRNCDRRLYVGDGVYAGRDSQGAIWLITQREDAIHCIALDPAERHVLLGYLQAQDIPEPRSMGTGDDGSD